MDTHATVTHAVNVRTEIHNATVGKFGRVAVVNGVAGAGVNQALYARIPRRAAIAIRTKSHVLTAELGRATAREAGEVKRTATREFARAERLAARVRLEKRSVVAAV